MPRQSSRRRCPGAFPSRRPHSRRHHRPFRHPPRRTQRAPSVQHLAPRSRWALDDERFGHAAAILTGDLCLSLSEEMFPASPRDRRRSPAAAARARAVFNVMRTEVMAGQYLDILEEVSGPSKPHGTAVARASAIIRYKSAKYSSEHPLGAGRGAGRGRMKTVVRLQRIRSAAG